MNRRLDTLRNEKAAILDEMESILTAIGNGEPTATQKRDYELLENKCDVIEEGIERELKFAEHEKSMAPDYTPSRPGRMPGSKVQPKQFRGPGGQVINCFAADQKLSDYRHDYYQSILPNGLKMEELSLGRWMRGAIIGDFKGAEREWEVMAAMGTRTNTAGGFMVPDPLADWWVDYARAQSVLVKAGMIQVEMDSETLAICKVSADPTIEMKAENEAFTGSEPTLERFNLVAKTCGTYTTCSRELIEDAPNAEELLETVLVGALASQMDKWAIQGSGGTEPLGLNDDPNIQTLSVGGSLSDWDKLLDGLEDLMDYNCDIEKVSYILSPANQTTLEKLVTGDGSNSAKMQRLAPQAIQDLKKLVSKQATDAIILMGDFSKFVCGMRTQPIVESSLVGQDAFKKHQYLIKVTTRQDFVPIQPTHIISLTGIS